ncbi:MAG: Putative glycosyltransferase [Anaerolinea thermophila]|uniref:Putative glycosyltransferase n=1 Tax=Anaerolinea thermophila TaxID=167964 RepID=A0A101FZ15_9CHLR|nr:MAG: Putative glycosyltransferase [Anaerolinea thermophila]
MINMKVSVIIPVYNEQTSLLFTYHKVKETNLVDEMLFVDDGSSDMSPSILSSIQDPIVKVYTHETNRGKGAAVRTGLQHANGDVILIQDADLEYDPRDYAALLKPFHDQQAQVVYGSRFSEAMPEGILFWNKLANRFLTFTTNLLYGTHLTDMETGYKVFHKDVLKQMTLTSDGFEIEPEITALLLKKNIPILEVPIRFHPRAYHQGKKIRPRDAFIALWTLLKVRFTRV